MSDEPVTMLPANSSPLERGLDLAFAKLLDRIEPPFPQLMNPQDTPVSFLPYLAADRGVLGWSSAASEASKRATVQASWSTKQLAGTEKGMALALKATGFSPKFVPWYEAGAAPYTLVIVATSDANQTPEDYQNLGYRLEDAKAERDQVVIKVEKKIPLEQRLYLAQYLRLASHQAVQPAAVVVEPEAAHLRLATVMHTARIWTVGPLSAVTFPPAKQFFGGVIRTASIIRIEATNG
ncbi:phage tail protein I [Pseudomonas gessardii]|uniref:Phage tail protein I n=1 Tax=Pseudomonas gessardii TaxID=78544 RepID=A0ABS9FD64_9PSED|nr:phage tail protein I [Pseudomonas gessardii]MCF4980753.1 phage tail protein I [Pseudomonas gessardii]MCF4988472.1 phage tail protein I [Pseudomonas gessardii]MCF5097497.1 phage tail protein I [Pseudomonas gessardii]MCF5109678.1 phage tail protein I [Pseudomonas gessardii]